MTNKPWKAEYWPMIVRELQIVNEKKAKNGERINNSIYIYDYRAGRVQAIIGETDDPTAPKSSYFYVTKPETMQKIIDNWMKFDASIQSNLKRIMKGYETKYLHKVLYQKRKEEFDALVAETNS